MVSDCSVMTMPPHMLWLLAVLVSAGDVCHCRTYSCPAICQCTTERVSCNRHTQENSQATFTLVSCFYVSRRLTHLPFRDVQSGTFKKLINVTRIEISQSDSIRTIQGKAFLSIHSLEEISIQNINQLMAIENGAFTDLPKLRYLSICNTGVRHFPDLSTISSMELFFFLELGDNMRINSIPANAFQGISKEDMYMNLVRNGFTEIKSHAFNGTRLDKVILKDNMHLSKIHNAAFEGAVGPAVLDVSSTALQALPTWGLTAVKVLKARSTPALKTLPPLENLLDLQEAELTYPSHCCAFHNRRLHNREKTTIGQFKNLTNDIHQINFHYPDMELCINSRPFKCSPKPDAFNPCEDLLGYDFLRCITWVITASALMGNLAVLVVLLSSPQKMTVSRFLMCNLAFADLCMGLYLLLIALVDHWSRREYYNHAMAWQTGTGCSVAGFLTVFASELSVYTLTTITLERWHTITNAMQTDRRLRPRHVVAMMAAGWGFSLLVALLPVFGVSNYSKVSICLPMDIETPASQGYVVALLVLNMAAFLTVCACYVGIYLSVRKPNMATRHGDTRIAKRMAVLIFTDFLCMAPISFFAISAAMRMPLITVSQSKILLVLFYPINSLCNPFLYTIFTRAFRRDMYMLLSRCGYCQMQAEFYRLQGLSGVALDPRNKRSRKSHSNQFQGYHIKLRGCFISKGAT
uniref:Thyrotropin receptor n=1 Tax=Electrophorus electricus TaxID=8005 RepID=A0AAY5EHL2_ELEEL